MALITCKECNREYSDVLESCIHCGYPNTRLVKYNKWQAVKSLAPKLRRPLSIVIVLFVLLYMISTVPSKSDFDRYIEQTLEMRIDKVDTNRFMKWLANTYVDFTIETRTDHYLILTINKVEVAGSQTTYLGVFNGFVPISYSE